MEIPRAEVINDLLESPNYAKAPGSIANVFIAASAAFEDSTDAPIPLYRGHAMSVNFQGLEGL